MAIAVQFDFPGASIGQYDEMNEMMGLLPGGPAAPQELFHCVMETDDGLRVFDVWESREAFEKFLQEKLVPIFAEVGVSAPPDVQFFEVHNYLAGGRWRR